MFPNFSMRSVEPELMDGVDYTPEELVASLSDIRLVNRFLGGRRTLLRHLLPMIEQLGRKRVRLLDLGTGSGDLPVAIVEWARKRKIEIDFVVIDLNRRVAREAHLLSAEHPEISTVQADARRPPFPPRSFDFVLASLFLHHFETPEAARLIASFADIARVAVVINDLRRHPIAYYSIKALTWMFRASRMVRYDAALSVQRGFTDHDVDEISRLAGMPLQVFRHFPYRFLAIASSVDSSASSLQTVPSLIQPVQEPG